FVAPTTPAVANNDQFTVTMNMPFTGNVLTNDQLLPSDGNPLHDSQAVLVSKPYHGVVDFRPDGTFTYTPFDNQTYPDSFNYVITNGPLTSSSGKVVLDMIAAPLPANTVIARAGFDQVAVASSAVMFSSLLTRTGPIAAGTLVNPSWDFGDPA